jgi:hypothetical protein
LRSRVYNALSPIHKAFLDHPELRPYFYHGAAFPDSLILADGKLSKEFLKARAIAEMFYDTFENLYSAEIDRGNWIPYIQGIISGSPFLAEYLWSERENIHPVPLRKLIEQSIQDQSQRLNLREPQLGRALSLLEQGCKSPTSSRPMPRASDAPSKL